MNKGRTALADWRDVIATVQADSRIELAPLDAAIVARTMSLPILLEMHDRQIVATGLVRADAGFDVRILTQDQSIIDAELLPVIS